MAIIDHIDQDLIEALKGGNKQKVTVLRGLKSDIKYRQIETREELTDEQVTEVLASSAKKRRESIEQYGAAGRQDLVDKEKFELDVIQGYLPEQLSEDELRTLVTGAIAESGAESPKDMGKVMKILMPRIKGKADGKLVNKLVSEILAK
jgi:uncharacterized protein YqeY